MNGFIVSDEGDMVGLVKEHQYFETYKEAVAASIKSGIDSITNETEITCAAIQEALSEGLLEEGDLDRALTNTFRVRFLLGEFVPNERNPYADMPDDTVCKPEHTALSLEATRESIVLLKNKHRLLPLDREAVKRVAVIGPLSMGDGCLQGGRRSGSSLRLSVFERGHWPELLSLSSASRKM